MKLLIPYKERALFSNLAKKHRANIIGYPISNVIMKDSVQVIGYANLEGENNDIKNLIQDLKNDSRVINIEYKNNFIIINVKQHIVNKILFQAGIFHAKPYVINNKGEYIFELASWKRALLINVFHKYKNIFDAKLAYIKKKQIKGIQLFNIAPQLTEKQKKCLQTAIDNGYYAYPRKITLEKLAKIAKLSYSTYQFHIQNAEKKIIPFLNKLV